MYVTNHRGIHLRAFNTTPNRNACLNHQVTYLTIEGEINQLEVPLFENGHINSYTYNH